MKRVFSSVITVLASSVGFLVLLGYLVPLPLFRVMRFELVNWAAILAGTAVLVGVANLIAVHFQKVRRREKGSVYSLLLLVALLGTFLLGMVFGPQHPWMLAAVDFIIVPVEASLMALLAVTLVYASVRLLRRRADFMSIVFIATALFVMLAGLSLPMMGESPLLGDLIGPWLNSSVVAGGARGLLIGVSLGALTAGLRVLFGADRPFGGK